MLSNAKNNRVVIVTGSTGAIGKAIARNLSRNLENRVVLVARDEAKAKKVLGEIIGSTGNENVEYALVDLARKKEIYRFAERFSGPVNILVNNAAVTPRSRLETPEGIEMQFATNVLGYFWMIDAFTRQLKQGSPSRVVNVASYWAGGMDLVDPEFKNHAYHNDSAYRQSKQADRMLTVAFADRLAPFGITVNACHPGDVNSVLSNNLGFGGHETPDEGADTPVWLAVSSDVEGRTGKYFEHRQESECYFGRDRKTVEELYRICSNY